MGNVVAVDPQVEGRIEVGDLRAPTDLVHFNASAPNNSNAAPVDLTAQGTLGLRVNSGAPGLVADVRVIVLGYYVPVTASQNALGFVPITPCALADTRHATRWAPGRSAGQTGIRVQISGSVGANQTNSDCGLTSPVHPDAEAAFLNVVAVTPRLDGNLKVSAAGQPAFGGAVNFGLTGGSNSNAAPFGLSTQGAIDVWTNSQPGQPATYARIVALGYYLPF